MTDDSDPGELKTEASARVLICPVMSSHGHPVHCAGSRCMAWRPLRVDGKEWRGYCGLAGTPVGILAQMQHEIMHIAARAISHAPADA